MSRKKCYPIRGEGVGTGINRFSSRWNHHKWTRKKIELRVYCNLGKKYSDRTIASEVLSAPSRKASTVKTSAAGTSVSGTTAACTSAIGCDSLSRLHLPRPGPRSICVTQDSYGVNRQLRARRSSGHKKELQEEIFMGACSFEKDIYPTTTIRKKMLWWDICPHYGAHWCTVEGSSSLNVHQCQLLRTWFIPIKIYGDGNLKVKSSKPNQCW